MTEESFLCPRREPGFPYGTAIPKHDVWMPGGTCSFCGSLSPDKFFEAINADAEIVPTDKSYKAYVRKDGHSQQKFYFQHLSKEDQGRFIEIYNNKKMKIAYPGHFYTMPFFCAPAEQR